MIIILGGGMAGLTVAYSLRGTGEKIVLLEKEPHICSFASSRNAAIFRTQEGDPYLSLIVKKSAVRLAEVSRQLGMPLVSGEGLLINPVETDYYEEEFMAMYPEAEGIRTRPMTFPLPDGSSFSGVFVPGNGTMDIHSLQQFLFSEIRKAGVDVRFISRISGINVKNDYVQSLDVQEGKNNPKSYSIPMAPEDVLVNSGGSWGREILEANGQWAVPLVPHKRHLYFLKDAGRPLNMPILWDERSEFYIRKEGAGYLATHGDETPTSADDYAYEENQTTHFIENLAREFPFASTMSMARSWACLRTFALDGRPAIGYDPHLRNLFWNAGWGGRGMSMALGITETIQDLFVRGYHDSETELENPFSTFRFI